MPFSVAKFEGRLVAYRFDGERQLAGERFEFVPSSAPRSEEG